MSTVTRRFLVHADKVASRQTALVRACIQGKKYLFLDIPRFDALDLGDD